MIHRLRAAAPYAGIGLGIALIWELCAASGLLADSARAVVLFVY